MAVAQEAAPHKGLTRRRRRQLFLGGQYTLFAIVVAIIAALADWPSLKQNFANLDVAKSFFPDIITIGLWNTVIFTLGGFAAGLVGGTVIALMRLSPVPPYRWLAATYIEVFRGLPAVLIFIFVGTGVPLAFPGYHVPFGVYGAAWLALGLISCAYMAETIRAGIQAVPHGQMEAARSLGMSHGRAMVSIIIPQAFRIIIPPLTNELVLLVKDSSLALFVGITLQERDLAKFGQDLASEKGNSTPIIAAGLCYLLITIPTGLLARRLEARQRRTQR